MLTRNKYFWLLTALFLTAGFLIVWLAYPPILRNLKENKVKQAELEQEIAEQQQYLAVITELEEQEAKLDTLHQNAELALPTSVSSELLLLQLDGLLASLGLSNASISAPFSQTIVGTTASSGSSTGEPTPSSQSGTTTTTPIVKNDGQTQSTFTVTGEMDYPKLQSLLKQLRSFARWNKITSVDLSTSDGKTTATVTAQVFWKAAGSNQFSGSDKQFLEKAETLFGGLTSYTTEPDATKEGSYGRTDPFAGL